MKRSFVLSPFARKVLPGVAIALALGAPYAYLGFALLSVLFRTEGVTVTGLLGASVLVIAWAITVLGLASIFDPKW